MESCLARWALRQKTESTRAWAVVALLRGGKQARLAKRYWLGKVVALQLHSDALLRLDETRESHLKEVEALGYEATKKRKEYESNLQEAPHESRIILRNNHEAEP